MNKKLNKRTKFTILAMVMIIAYTVVSLILAANGKEVPAELTVSWFGAWTVELALLFGLKIKAKE